MSGKRAGLFAWILMSMAVGFAATPDRIRGPVERDAAIRLLGNVPAEALAASDQGPLDPYQNLSGIRLVLKQTPEQAADLARLLEQQRDPSSPDYQNWLTPEQFGERFGMSPNDLGRITEWLRSTGLSVDSTARARNWIVFSGTAGQVSNAFHTELHRYLANDETHFANASAPSVPAALDEIVERIGGLDDFRPRPQPARVLRRGLMPDFTTSSGVHYLGPDDLATIYNVTPLLTSGIDGTGQKLVISGQTDINLSDLRAFRTEFGLAPKDPQLVLVGADPGASAGDQIEANLDLEWSGAIARNATIIYVYSGNVFESIQYAIDQDLAPVISDSYGGCEAGSPTGFRSVVQQANAEGITLMNAAGDSGAAGCDYDASEATHGPSVIFPANIPEVTAVGGTEFNETGNSGWNAQNGTSGASVTGYLPEKAWNDTALGHGIAAGGGGASALFTKPWWQSGPGVPSDGARDVPDIALSASGAHDAYLIYANGALMAVGGTSAASPSFAGIVTLLNHYLVTKGGQAKPGLGNINPNLYAIAQTAGAPIHDITVGDNIVPCAASTTGCTTGSFGYKAGTGYDLVTGLGSVDAYNLAVKWQGTAVGSGTTTTLTASPTSLSATGTTQLTAIVSAVTGSAKPTGTVSFSVGSARLGSAPVLVSGTSSSATLTVSAASLATGSNTIGASFTPTGTFAGSAATTTIAVTQPVIATTTLLSAAPAAILTTASTTLTATVKPASGSAAPAGSVSFLLGSTTLSRVPLVSSGTSATATLSLAGSKLQPGANAIVANYTATGNFANSTASVPVAVSSPPVPTSTTLTASPANLVTTGSTVLTATVKPATGSTAPSGTVTFSEGNTPLGTSTLAASGSSATASLTVSGGKLTVGPNTVVASYSGSAAFGASASSPVTMVVATPVVSTSLSVSASPSTIASGGTSTLTVSVKAATGSTLPNGSVAFTLSGTLLGSANLSPAGTSSSAAFTVAAKSLQTGTNSILATYGGTVGFATASESVSLLLTAPAVATSTVLSATPSTIAQSASTQIAATVRPASGSVAPAGTVAFSAGRTSLGSATLVVSGTSGSASITVKGSNLASGSNTITAIFTPTGNFASSTGSVTETVTPTPVATTAALTAASTLITTGATTAVTVLIKPASGTTAPSGSVTFTTGNVSLGSATLSASGPNGTATFTVKGASLPQKTNTVTATYAGSAAFGSSSASVSIGVN